MSARTNTSLGALTALGAAIVMFTGPAVAHTAAQAANPHCGDTLTASTKLVAPLDCSFYDDGPALRIAASGTTLDLGGFTLTGPGVQRGTMGVQSDDVSRVTIKNGTIANFAYDVALFAGSRHSVSGLTLRLDGSRAGTGLLASGTLSSTFSKLTVPGNAFRGIALYNGARNQVTSSSVSGSSISFLDVFGTQDTWSSNTSTGIYGTTYGFAEVSGTANTWKQNKATSGRYGFVVNNSGDNALYGTALPQAPAGIDRTAIGLDAVKGTSARLASGASGPSPTGTVSLLSNTADANSIDGFWVTKAYRGVTGAVPGQGSKIAGNEAAGNGDYGFLDQGSVGAVWSGNTATHNGITGIALLDPANATIQGNRADSNIFGIYVGNNVAGQQVADFSKNTASGNSGIGLLASFGVPGSGNVAKLNNQRSTVPVQCSAVDCA